MFPAVVIKKGLKGERLFNFLNLCVSSPNSSKLFRKRLVKFVSEIKLLVFLISSRTSLIGNPLFFEKFLGMSGPFQVFLLRLEEGLKFA